MKHPSSFATKKNAKSEGGDPSRGCEHHVRSFTLTAAGSQQQLATSLAVVAASRKVLKIS